MAKSEESMWVTFSSRYALPLGIIVAWESLPRLGLVPPMIMAPFSAVVLTATAEYPRILQHLQVTGLEIVLAVAIAWGCGLLIGIALGANERVSDIVVPLVSSVYAVPIVVIYPVLAAWFGLGLQAKYLFGGIYGLFPVVLNTVAGIRSVDKRFVTLGRSIGASKLQIITQIIVPLSLPGILPGIRLGTALAVIGVVVAEMLASAAGIGYLIEYNRTIFRTPSVYLAILVVVGIVAVIDRALFVFEKRLIYWKK
jgi:NitT/TauT family transport system permease protein/taurine transport system permease protein